MDTNLTGLYQIDKANLFRPGGYTFVIGTRHRSSPNKPRNFLLFKLPGGGFKYVSSLYPLQGPGKPLEADSWTFDYKGQEYRLSLKKAENQALIVPYTPPPNSIDSNNIMELGAKFTPPENLPDAAA